MHGFAETAATVAFAIGVWPVVALATASELVCRVRWRLLWSRDLRWKAKLHSDVQMLLALWRADVRRLFAEC